MSALTSVLMPLLLQSGAPAEATPDCSESKYDDKCSAESFEDKRRLYDVSTIEELASNRTVALRAFIVNGEDRDVITVMASRPAKDSPQIEALRTERSAGDPVIRSFLTLDQWQTVSSEAELFERRLMPVVGVNRDVSGDGTFCFHGWTVLVEATDELGAIRRQIANACDGTLAVRFAFGLAKLAFQSDPACQLLDSRARNEATGLEVCGRLTGDRLSAAEAYNRLNDPDFLSPRANQLSRQIAFFAPDAELHWTADWFDSGPTEAARSWQEHIGDGRFYPERLMGDTPDRVQVEGIIRRRDDSPENKLITIPVTLLWVRENGAFQLKRLDLQAAK